MDGLLCELLSEHALHHVFLAGYAIANADENTTSNITCKRAAKNDSRESEWPYVVRDGPCTSAQSDLEEGVTIEQDDDSNEKSQGKGMVSFGFMGLVVIENLALNWPNVSR